MRILRKADFFKYHIVVIFYVRSLLGPFQMFRSCRYSNLFFGCFSQKEWQQMFISQPEVSKQQFSSSRNDASLCSVKNAVTFLGSFYSKQARGQLYVFYLRAPITRLMLSMVPLVLPFRFAAFWKNSRKFSKPNGITQFGRGRKISCGKALKNNRVTM